ncbi:Lon protease family protein [Hydrogenovibrio marinus]|uniref:endopeptidase La n=1 Tax=Hydrogenovibrio marinus TaxID=28885 RepID=A0A066ZX75_HYDMR|nr:ATP-binding protein [Hydrogenovibrio marinus]KDN94966.1 ATP-dependent protease [Hydrogenovibrio marinus]BBN59431.1 ATP-dependent protease [Hydrogenovibrio marinus]
MRKLSADQLYRFTTINPEKFEEQETNVNAFMKRFHPRAYQSLNFGLHLKRNQNHIFIMGEPGVGRIGMTKSVLRDAAARRDIPQDVVLVSDFSESNKTQYLYFKAGHGHAFKAAMEEFITQLKTQLPVVFDGHVYQLKNQQLENDLAQKQEAALTPAFELAESLSIEIQQTENNFVLLAVVDGERLRMSELKNLEEPLQKHFLEALDQVEEELNKGLTRFPFLQHEYMDAGKKLNTRFANDHLAPLTDALKMEFGENDSVKQYLESLKDAVISKLHLFWDQSGESVTSTTQNSMEDLLAEQHGFSIFEVNLLVDHSGLKHAPIIYEQNASMPKLFGYTINSASANATDTLTLAMNHQAGLLQKANGGFLLLNVESLLKDPEIWSNLKAALLSKKLTFEIPSSSSVVPYHLPDYPLNVTLVLLGRAIHFYALQEIDSQFSRLFKVQVEFEVELERTEEHELVLAKQLENEIKDWDDLPVSVSAYERLIEYASRLAESESRLYTNKAILRDVLAEANAFARANDETEITRSTIEATILQRDFHTGLMEDYFHRAIIEEQVLISVTGSHVGQVNGLTVLTVGRQSFGQPVRITAQASSGDEGVVDIEREVEMAGPIHSKGMLILSGYLRGRYMKFKAWGFSASIVMEQTYDGVEGDSASSAELLALISSISQTPLRQDLAITGSVNQFGEIQPIGGVNEKIEGFFKVCKARGLTGTQGAVVPEANTKHLMLNAEVREAVESGQFHIYAMSHIDDALGLFTDMPVGKVNDKGEFPEGSVNDRVIKALEKMNEKHDESHDD